MNWLRKLPGYRKTPAGMERHILRLVPRLLVWGSLALLLVSGFARLLPWNGSAAEIRVSLDRVDIYVISLVVLHWTVVVTLAIGAFIVMVMKGPAYVADAYPVQDADKPAEPPA